MPDIRSTEKTSMDARTGSGLECHVGSSREPGDL
jgi:hypothetical protein